MEKNSRLMASYGLTMASFFGAKFMSCNVINYVLTFFGEFALQLLQVQLPVELSVTDSWGLVQIPPVGPLDLLYAVRCRTR